MARAPVQPALIWGPPPAIAGGSISRMCRRKSDHRDHRRADQQHPPFTDAAHHADGCRQPDAGRGRQIVDVLALLAADDHAGAEKADAGHDALDDAAHIAVAIAGGDDDLRSGEADQRQRPHAGWLAVQVAVEPERCARERGRSQPQDDLGGVHGSAS